MPFRRATRINICVPTGNFGNILAAYYAKRMGVPVNKLICASNSNNVLTDFLRTGVYDRNRPFYTTMSPSMDILISSNLERLLYAFSGEDDELVSDYMTAAECQQAAMRSMMPSRHRSMTSLPPVLPPRRRLRRPSVSMWKEKNYLIDTHSAVAFHVLEQYRKETGDNTVAVVASTASPFKFGDAVLKAIGVDEVKSGVALLDQLAEVSGRPRARTSGGTEDQNASL